MKPFDANQLSSANSIATLDSKPRSVAPSMNRTSQRSPQASTARKSSVRPGGRSGKKPAKPKVPLRNRALERWHRSAPIDQEEFEQYVLSMNKSLRKYKYNVYTLNAAVLKI